MKFVANFKAYKNDNDVSIWLNTFHNLSNSSSLTKKSEVIIAPQFTALTNTWKFIKDNTWKCKVSTAAQTVSQYGTGSYTGEVTAGVLKTYCQYVLVGHSERRKYFFENQQVVNNKIQISVENAITPIVCISKISEYQNIDERYLEKIIIAYEPLAAIGSGHAEDVHTAREFMVKIKKINKSQEVLYGGSVSSGNVKNYSSGGFDGVLVGKASLDPHTFIEIIHNGTKV